MLLDALPPESATATQMRNDATRAREEREELGVEDPFEGQPAPDPAERPWSQQSMLLGSAIDELRLLRYVLTAVNSSKGSRPATPPLVRRPGVGKKDQRAHATNLTASQRRKLELMRMQTELAQEDSSEEAPA